MHECFLQWPTVMVIFYVEKKMCHHQSDCTCHFFAENEWFLAKYGAFWRNSAVSRKFIDFIASSVIFDMHSEIWIVSVFSIDCWNCCPEMYGNTVNAGCWVNCPTSKGNHAPHPKFERPNGKNTESKKFLKSVQNWCVTLSWKLNEANSLKIWM